jgi:hypothetical protein
MYRKMVAGTAPSKRMLVVAASVDAIYLTSRVAMGSL